MEIVTNHSKIFIQNIKINEKNIRRKTMINFIKNFVGGACKALFLTLIFLFFLLSAITGTGVVITLALTLYMIIFGAKN